MIENGSGILLQIADDKDMKDLWKAYQRKYDYAKGLSWEMVMVFIQVLYDKIA